MLAQIEKVFGSWKGPRPELLISAAPPEALGRQVHLVHLPGAVQTQVLVGNLAITRRDPDWFRPVLANSIYRRRIPFAPGDEYPRTKGLHVQPAQRNHTLSTSTDFSPSTPPCATKLPPPRSPKCSTKWTACARSQSLPKNSKARKATSPAFSRSVSPRRTASSASSPPSISTACPTITSKPIARKSAP